MCVETGTMAHAPLVRLAQPLTFCPMAFLSHCQGNKRVMKVIQSLPCYNIFTRSRSLEARFVLRGRRDIKHIIIA